MIVSNEVRPTPAYILLKEVIHLRKQLDKLQDENSKLRDLVRGLDYCSDELNSAECERCPLYDPADPVLEPKCVRMMREMGIEMREIEIDKEEL